MTHMGPPTLDLEQAGKVIEALKTLLRRHRNNQSALARELHISQAAVNDLLQQKNKPSFKTAERIAAKIGVPVWHLLGKGPASPDAGSHPTLFSTLAFVGDRVPVEVRERVILAASFLPDFQQSTWIAMLLDPAHVGAPASRPAPDRTTEIPIVTKKAT